MQKLRSKEDISTNTEDIAHLVAEIGTTWSIASLKADISQQNGRNAKAFRMYSTRFESDNNVQPKGSELKATQKDLPYAGSL